MVFYKAFGLLSTLLFVMSPTQCESKSMEPCTPSIEPAITVTVTDAQTGAPLDATVRVDDENFQEELQLVGVSADGQTIYGGAFERPGTYTIWVERAGYQPTVIENVDVTKGECHVQTQRIEVRLNPK